MARVAGKSKPLARGSQGLKDSEVRRVISALEEKIIELDRRVFDLEQRAEAGGI